jgi:hypothetical protein
VIVVVLPSGKLFDTHFKAFLRIYFAKFLPIPVTFVKAITLKDALSRDYNKFSDIV